MKSLVVVGLVNRLQLPQKGGDCYVTAEQAIELLFLMFYIFLLSPDLNTGGLSINNQPISSRVQGSTVVTNDKTKT